MTLRTNEDAPSVTWRVSLHRWSSTTVATSLSTMHFPVWLDSVVFIGLQRVISRSKLRGAPSKKNHTANARKSDIHVTVRISPILSRRRFDKPTDLLDRVVVCCRIGFATIVLRWEAQALVKEFLTVFGT